jgi:hypothetical protein
MFNTSHIIYIVVSLVATVGLLIGFRFIKDQKYKVLVLKICALATFIIHISIMWVDFLSTGTAVAYDYILFPKYLCNMCMYLLMAAAFIPNKDGRAFKWIATFTAYAGFFGGMITLFLSEYLANDPSMAKYETFKSLMSHSTMLLGCLYLFVGGFIKIRWTNMIPFVVGLVCNMLVGFFINALYAWCGLGAPNAMYLQRTAMDGVDFFTGYGIGLCMIVLTALFLAAWEQFAVPKKDRWKMNPDIFGSRKNIA